MGELRKIPLIGGLLDDEAPEPTVVGLDPGTKGLMADQAQKASQGPEYYSGILNQNTEKAGQLGQNPEQVQQSASALGMDPNQFQAIRRVYNNQAQQGIQQLKGHNEVQGQLMKADYMNKISKAMLGQQAQQVQQYQFLTNAYMQQEQARAQTINSLFQVGNQVIGMNAKMKLPPQSQALQADPGQAYAGGFGDRNPYSNNGEYGGIA